MSIVARIGTWLLKSTLSNPDSWLVEYLTGGKASGGVTVNPATTQNSAIALACVNVRSQDIAKLPLILYRRRSDGGRERAVDHPLTKLIKRPREHLSSGAWRQTMQANLDLRGNGYSRIVRDRRNQPIELIPLADDWVLPMMSSDGTIFYDVRMWGTGKKERLTSYDVLHLKDRSDDGFCGKSVIARARDVIGMDLISAKHGANLYGNAARPDTIFIPKTPMGKAGRQLFKKELNEEFGGDNLYKTGIVGQEMDVKTIGMTMLDAQWIDGRKLSRAEVASIFRVPPHKVGIMDNATFSNIEHQSLEYVTDTLMPIARVWEEELNETLLREDEKESFFFEFLFDALLRGDFLSRMQGMAIRRQWGTTYNEIADQENWPRVPPDKGGDDRFIPMNMWPMGEKRPEPAAAVGGKAEDGADAEAEKDEPQKTAKLLQIPVQR